MERIAKFSKVSFEQFQKDYQGENALEIYDKIILPKRATKGSAGYDFFSPITTELKVGESVIIPTGIRAKIAEGWVLQIYPRSGLGFKYRLQLDNTVGIIDSDYFSAENEGHIKIKLTNDGKSGKSSEILQGAGFSQGIFMPFGITEDDEVNEIRIGGFGSTDK